MVFGVIGEINDSKYKVDIFVYKDILVDDMKFLVVKVLILENFMLSLFLILILIFCFVGRDDLEDYKL